MLWGLAHVEPRCALGRHWLIDGSQTIVGKNRARPDATVAYVEVRELFILATGRRCMSLCFPTVLRVDRIISSGWKLQHARFGVMLPNGLPDIV